MVMKPDQFNFIMVIVYQMILIRLSDRAHEIVTTKWESRDGGYLGVVGFSRYGIWLIFIYGKIDLKLV